MRPRFQITLLSGLTSVDTNSKKYEDKYAEVQSLLTEEKIDQLCSHEAGHLIFFRKMGEHAQPIGPVIQRCSDGSYKETLSSIDVPGIALSRKHLLNYSETFLEEIALGSAAGGAFVRFFHKNIPESEWGTANDRCQFKEHCSEAYRKSFGQIRHQWEQRWQKAEDEVFDYLRLKSANDDVSILLAKTEVRAKFILESE